LHIFETSVPIASIAPIAPIAPIVPPAARRDAANGITRTGS